jgi:hypothetical protein
MTLIILGLLLWWGAHLFKRLAPARRAAMGDAGKGLVTVGVLAGVVLMVIGYRGNTAPDLWYPPAFLTHVNNLLMLLAVYLYAASGMKTRITRVIRHPQLTAVKTWAVAHLLVNGDAGVGHPVRRPAGLGRGRGDPDQPRRAASRAEPACLDGQGNRRCGRGGRRHRGDRLGAWLAWGLALCLKVERGFHTPAPPWDICAERNDNFSRIVRAWCGR